MMSLPSRTTAGCHAPGKASKSPCIKKRQGRLSNPPCSMKEPQGRSVRRLELAQLLLVELIGVMVSALAARRLAGALLHAVSFVRHLRRLLDGAVRARARVALSRGDRRRAVLGR